MSLIADSLKKAIKEKSPNVTPGINLLKNLGSKNKPRVDPKEVKRIVFLIVILATILAYLLLADPFGPNRHSKMIKSPIVAKVPPVKPAPTPKPAANQPPSPVHAVSSTTPNKLPEKEPENIPLIGPGMSEVTVPKNEEFGPKPLPGPKKEPTRLSAKEDPIQLLEPDQKIGTPKDSKKNIEAEEKASIKLKPVESTKIPETPTPKTKVFSPSKRPWPNIVKDSDHYFNRAIFYQQSRNWEKALKNYSKAAKLNANNPDIYNNIGVIYKELGKYDQAIEEFLKAIDLNPEYAKPYNNIGVVYYAKKDFLSAIRNYEKAISIDPENLGALNNLAVTYKRTGLVERAKTVLNQALKINPAHAGTHYNLAVFHEGKGNIESAIHFYQSFVELASSSHPTLSAQVKKHIKSLN